MQFPNTGGGAALLETMLQCYFYRQSYACSYVNFLKNNFLDILGNLSLTRISDQEIFRDGVGSTHTFLLQKGITKCKNFKQKFIILVQVL